MFCEFEDCNIAEDFWCECKNCGLKLYGFIRSEILNDKILCNMKFKHKDNMDRSELFKLFGQYARYRFGFYYICFDKKDFSADNPSDLFKKLENYYNENILRKAN